MSKPGEIVFDEQTGQSFEVNAEGAVDIISAWLSALYSLAAIAFLGWVLLDTWSAQYSLWPAVLETSLKSNSLSVTVFRLIIYTAIGGGMGAAVNNLRSFVSWHAERKAFGWRFVWKYIALPPLGATLAVLVYGILQGGMAVFNGGNVGGTGGTVTALSAWATGTLAGYGSHKVFIWLDDKVNTLFKVETKTTTVPDLSGKSPAEAEQALATVNLKIGEKRETPAPNPTLIGKVIGQNPKPLTDLACDSEVDIVVGAETPVPNIDEPGKNGQPVKDDAAAPGAQAANVATAGAGMINPQDVKETPNGGGHG